jgi:5'-deoxynucleotidase YfbR-like HD superfamily hydrolase
MLSGRRLDLLDPSPLDIEIEDIAHGLARVARWNGQTTGPAIFSVAQHSLLVEAIYHDLEVNPLKDERLAALLHDAPEYVVGDMISPFKAVIGADYKAVEHRLLTAIHLRFGIMTKMPDRVTKRIKAADQIAAYLEAITLAGFKEEEAKRFFGNPPVDLTAYDHFMAPWTAEMAKTRFLERFSTLEQK